MYEMITIFLCTKIQFLCSIQEKNRKLQLTVFMYSISGEKTMVEVPGGAPMQIVITITVQDSEGHPLIGAAVRLSPTVNGGNGTTTSPDGKVQLTVDNGTYTAGASMAGYKPKSGEPVVDNKALIALEAE